MISENVREFYQLKEFDNVVELELEFANVMDFCNLRDVRMLWYSRFILWNLKSNL